ncbi:MAG: cyanase [Polyangiales bacterium]
MEQSELAKALFEAKRKKNLSWAALSQKTGFAELWLAALFYGEASATPEIAAQLVDVLDLPEWVEKALVSFPIKGGTLESRSIPTDPFLYRLYEIVAVYGLPLKDVVQEKFGDGIMSAVDFTMDVQKQDDPKGDRVVLTLSGKFLPYKRW